MAQNWTDDVYEPSYEIAFTELASENNFKCLRSNFSGTGVPSSPVEGQIYWNTTSKDFKYYNGTAWDDLLGGYIQGTASLKLWVYSNTAVTGWAIDGTIYDLVLAFKGGTNAYNVNGGTWAGTWETAGFTHNHRWYVASPTSSYNSYTFSYDGSNAAIQSIYNPTYNRAISVTEATAGQVLIGSYTEDINTTSNWTDNYVQDGDNTYRPAAAVGTLQYPVL